MIGFVVGLILLAVVLAALIGLGMEDQGTDPTEPTSDASKIQASRGRFGRLIRKVGNWLPPMIP